MIVFPFLSHFSCSCPNGFEGCFLKVVGGGFSEQNMLFIPSALCSRL